MNNCMRTACVIFLFALITTANCFGWEQADVNGIHYRWGRSHVPDRIVNFRNPKAHKPMAPKPFIPAENFVPTGLYAGEWGEAFWDYTFTNLVEQHGNSYWINGSYTGSRTPSKISSNSYEGLVEIAKRAARLGIRIYYQNSASPIHWPSRVKITTPRQKVYEKVKAWAEKTLPEFTTDPELKHGILAWSPTEEIDMETAQEPLLAKLRNEVFKKLDPYHPALILLKAGTGAIQEELFKMWGDDIPIIAIDPYVNHRAIPRTAASRRYIKKMTIWQNVAMAHDVKLWIVVPAFSQNNNYPSKGPGGWLPVTPENMNLYGWTGLAYGSSGFYIYVEYSRWGSGRAVFTRFDWQPTEEYIAATRFFRVVRRLAPIISNWSPAKPTIVTSPIAEGVMKHPEFEGEFLVIANTNEFTSAKYNLSEDTVYYDLETFRRLKDSVEMDPAMGQVLFKGSKAELKKIQRLIGEGAGTLKETSLAPQTTRLWTTAKDNEELVASRTKITNKPFTLGGKGGKPWIYSEKRLDKPPKKSGDILDWADGVKIPAGTYFPPRPGKNETMLFLKWDFSRLQKLSNLLIESACFELKTSGISGGRVAVYPVINDSDILMDQAAIEFMPRWEIDQIDQFKGKEGPPLRIEIGGMVQQWIKKQLPNKGLLVVYTGWPDTIEPVEIKTPPELKIKYRRRHKLFVMSKN